MLMLFALAALAPTAARAAVTPPRDGILSQRLAELAKPSVRSAPPAEQSEALGLAADGPGSLLREGNRTLVEVRFDHGAAAAVGDLRQAGAEIVNVSQSRQTVTAAVKPSELSALNGVPGVVGAKQVLEPIAASTDSSCPSGSVVSEGVHQLQAGDSEGEARQAFGVDGSGVTVGILSDSFNRATEAADESGPIATHEAEDVASGDLPGPGNTCPGEQAPVNTALDDYAPGPEDPVPADEGRAMGQIVHDLAPGAKLAFATAFTGETAFAENIETLAKPTNEGGAGAQVIADDVSYFEEPFFQEGPVGVAIANVRKKGVTYFSSAGNNNLINGGRDIASWEAPQFRSAGSCPSAIAAFEAQVKIALHPTHCMDFDPGAGTDTTFRVTVSSGSTLVADLQWEEAWEAVGTDLDAFLIGPGGEVVSWSVEDNPTDGRPFELLGWENETGAAANVQLVINRYSGAGARLKMALMENGGGVTATEYESSSGGDVVGPTIFGHNGGEATVSVGAIRYNATQAPEPYSSRGPVTHYFGPVDGTTPASLLGSPETLLKPDVVATDGGASTFFASCVSNTWRFFGTSAAAPHAAAVTALELQAVPGANPEELTQALLESAEPVGAFPRPGTAVGAGVINASAAIAKLKSEPPPVRGFQVVPIAPQNCDLSESHSNPEGGEQVITNPPQAVGVEPAKRSEAGPPTTFLRKRPPKTTRTSRRSARLAFAFGSDQAGVTFLCGVDTGRFRPCPAKFTRSYELGGHVLRVKARNGEGRTDATPAVYRFRVAPLHARRAGR